MKTPLNYTGNKSRLIHQLNEIFPENISTFVDLFCGGGSVGLGSSAEKVVFIDNNMNVIKLLQHLSKYKAETTISRLEKIISHYHLSYSAAHGYSTYSAKIKNAGNNGLKEYNKDGFYKMRNDYNNSSDKFRKHSLDLLYLLMVYGFNNDLRFNSDNQYNLPVGKTDMNKNNIKKIINFVDRANEKDCKFLYSNFDDPSIMPILLDSDFVYADPPYMLGHATYNESNKWQQTHETKLYSVLNDLSDNDVKFGMSNVLKKEPVGYNDSLLSWINDSDLVVDEINYHYRSSSYNKKNRDANEQEVLIRNYN